VGPWRPPRCVRPLRPDARAGAAVTTAETLHALRDVALLGAGLALLPDWLVDDDVATGSLRFVLPGWTTPTVVASAIHKIEQRRAPRIRALVEHPRAAYGSATATRTERA
jgi:DNA-binding transcriptional LysR family regulator